MIIIGVDPGLSGAIAMIENKEILKVYPMPSLLIAKGKKKSREYSITELRIIYESIRDYATQHTGEKPIAKIEMTHSFPSQSKPGNFKAGYGYALHFACWNFLNIPAAPPIAPVKWKKKYGLIGEKKDGSILAVQRLYPYFDFNELKGKDFKHGAADAILIALYED